MSNAYVYSLFSAQHALLHWNQSFTVLRPVYPGLGPVSHQSGHGALYVLVISAEVCNFSSCQILVGVLRHHVLLLLQSKPKSQTRPQIREKYVSCCCIPYFPFITSHYLCFATIWIITAGTLLHALKFSARLLHIPPLHPFFTWPFRKTSNRPSQMGSTSRMVHQLRKKSRKVVPSQTNLSFPRICFQIRVRWIIWWASSRPRRSLWFLRW